MLTERALGSRRARQEVGQLGVGAILGNEPLEVVAPAPSPRLADDRERRRADLGQGQRTVARH
jgi:hypothetical protein